MTPREIFAIIVRTVGLLTSLNAGLILVAALLLGIVGGPGQLIALAIIGIPLLTVGIWMLRGAPELVDFAYKERRQPPTELREPLDWLGSDQNS